MESFLKQYKLNANLLAWHAEYPDNDDMDRGLRDGLLHGKEDPYQVLKFDSNGIWSVGPIEQITWQGPARHALAASIWPKKDAGGTRCGELAGTYRRTLPTPESLGLVVARAGASGTWPELCKSLWDLCSFTRMMVIANGRDPNGLFVATRKQIREFRIALQQYPTVDKPPRVCESGDADADWPAISRSRESVSDWEKADPHANQWQHGGHFVLKCIVNFGDKSRDRGEKGLVRLAVQKQKKDDLRKTTHYPNRKNSTKGFAPEVS